MSMVKYFNTHVLAAPAKDETAGTAKCAKTAKDTLANLAVMAVQIVVSI